MNYIRLGHLWEIEEIGRKTYNYEGGKIDENVKALKKHCDEKGAPCLFFPYDEQKNYPLSFEFCTEGEDSVSCMTIPIKRMHLLTPKRGSKAIGLS